MDSDSENQQPPMEEHDYTDSSSNPEPSTSQMRVVPISGLEFTKTVALQTNVQQLLPPDLHERMQRVQRSQIEYSNLFSKLTVVINELSERYAGGLSPDTVSSEGYASKNTSSGDETYDNASGSSVSNDSIRLRNAVINEVSSDTDTDIEENANLDENVEEEEQGPEEEEHGAEEEEHGAEEEQGSEEEDDEFAFEAEDMLEIKLEEGNDDYEELGNGDVEDFDTMGEEEEQGYENEFDYNDSDNSMRKSHSNDSDNSMRKSHSTSRSRTYSDMMYDDYLDDKQYESLISSPSSGRIDSPEGELINVALSTLSSLSSSPQPSTSTAIHEEDNNTTDFRYQPSPPREKEMMFIGPHGTMIDVMEYSSISWESPSSATRKLLGYIFDMETLATHSLTGRPSPAFFGRERPLKNQLDPEKIADIIYAVTLKTGAIERDIRAAITTKCADTAKTYKIQQERMNKMFV